MHALSTITESSSSEMQTLQEPSITLKVVTLLALTALSIVSFSFAGLLLTGTIVISSAWLFNAAVGGSILVGCVALFYAYLSLTTPSKEEMPISSSTKGIEERNSSPTSIKKEKRYFQGMKPPTETSKSHSTASSSKKSTSSIITAAWKYDTKGNTIAGSIGYQNELVKAKNTQPNQPSFCELTDEIRNVRGDGNCGYYSYGTILIENAARDIAFRDMLVQTIDAIFPETASITLFEESCTQENLQDLKRQVLALFARTGKETAAQILNDSNGALLDKFLRAVIMANIKSKHLDQQRQALLTYDPALRNYPLREVITKNAWMQQPMIEALNQLLGVEIGAIHFAYAGELTQNGTMIVNDNIRSNYGYLVFITNHYLAAFPRKENN